MVDGDSEFWKKPEGFHTGISLFNTLTKRKDELILPNGRQLGWYQCGPTVYDVSHMGHARTYLTFDIIRRIFENYFALDVYMVMNVTDVDDKIILKSQDPAVGMTHVELAAKYEKEFMDDMASLGVRPPNALTRVTDYMTEIVEYIEKIISNGYAYESNNSVYFDVVAYQRKHTYGKLEPNSVGNAEKFAEGEGSLSLGLGDKRSSMDFALWKSSKPNEPKWPSPWGEGRPGWHIECSVMASSILGPNPDLHSGGIDLKFPHHENEVAQAEAYYDHDQWMNYFLHAGHLHIKGRKMAKSLKNFITIQEALKTYSARQIRMLFLMSPYNAPMDYSPEAMDEAVAVEKGFSEYFHNLKFLLHEAEKSPSRTPEHFRPQDAKLRVLFSAAVKECDNCLKEDLDYPGVVRTLTGLIKAHNTYVLENKGDLRLFLLRAIGEYISKMLTIFGMGAEGEQIGFVESGGDDSQLRSIIDALSTFRCEVRLSARKKEPGQILEACDKLRDQILPLKGVRLEDSNDGSCVWKLDDPECILRDREREIQAKEEKRLQKEEAQRIRCAREAARLEKMKINPSEMYRNQDDKYSSFCDKGIPHANAEGTPLTKTQMKKLTKEYNKQKSLYEKYLKSQN